MTTLQLQCNEKAAIIYCQQLVIRSTEPFKLEEAWDKSSLMPVRLKDYTRNIMYVFKDNTVLKINHGSNCARAFTKEQSSSILNIIKKKKTQ